MKGYNWILFQKVSNGRHSDTSHAFGSGTIRTAHIGQGHIVKLAKPFMGVFNTRYVMSKIKLNS